MAEKNRLKLVYVTEELVAAFLFGDLYHQGNIFLRRNDLPNDVELVGVCYDFAKQAFAFKLRHDTFDVVPIGKQIPTVKVQLSQYRLALTKKQRGEIKKWLKQESNLVPLRCL